MHWDKALGFKRWAVFAACATMLQLEVASAQAPACPGPVLATSIAEEPDRTGIPIYLDARRFTGGPEQLAEASGDVVLTRADQRLETQLLQFNPVNSELTLPQPLIYRDLRVELQADSVMLPM